MSDPIQAGSVRTPVPADAEREKAEQPTPERHDAVFVLRYDEEITYLVNEGVIRSGLLPSGFKES